MKRILLIACVLLLPFSTSNAQNSRVLKMIQGIPLQGVRGRIDHMAIDLKRQRLFVACEGNDSVEVIDLRSGKVIKTIAGLNKPQGVAFAPELNKLFVACSGSSECEVLSGSSFRSLAKIKFPQDPDNVRYDPRDKLIYVGYSNGIGIIDAKKDKLVEDIPLSGHPEAFEMGYDDTAFVNMPDSSHILVIDSKTKKVKGRMSSSATSGNYPMALDKANHRLFIGFRDPGLLIVFDADTHREIAQAYIGGDCDDMFYDVSHKRIYVSCGEGSIQVFKQIKPNKYVRIEKVQTHKGARTSLFVPQTDRFYLAAPASSTKAAAVLVYEIK